MDGRSWRRRAWWLRVRPPRLRKRAAKAAPPGRVGVELVWDTFRAPGTGWNEERIETFQEVNPGVTVEFRPLTGSSQQDNYGKMYAMHAADDLGDIVAFDPSHFHFWRAIDKGIIMPLDDLVDGCRPRPVGVVRQLHVVAVLPGQPLRPAQLGLGRLRHAGHQRRAV